MEDKNTVYILLVLLIIFGIGWYLLNLNKPVTQITEQSNNNQKTSQDTSSEAQQIPKFLLGSVSRIEGKNIFIKIGLEEKVIVVDDNTTIVKHVINDGISKNIPINFDEIKPSLQIAVYYNDSSDSGYRVERVQVLNF